MQAIEFNSVISNGSILVPKRYRNQVNTGVRVILLVNDIKNSITKKKNSPKFADFEKKWAGAFKVSSDYNNAKREYLNEKYQ